MDLKKLYQYEMMFSEDFARIESRPYGLLFHTPEIPDSYDGNHAVICDLNYDLARALGEIKNFYRSKSLTPRVFQSFQAGEEEILFPVLKSQGFTISEQPDRLFIRQPEAWAGSGPDRPKIKQIDMLKDDFLAFMVREYGSPRLARVIQKRLASKNFYLFVYFEDDRPVAMASLNHRDSFSRVDDVLTDAAYRNRGFATSLIDHIIKFHSEKSNNTLYLFASNPAAISVYAKQGFAESDLDRILWSAWLAQA